MPHFEIRGVIPPMLTPFTEEGDVDFDAHGENIRRWNAQHLAGYLVLGSNSETPYLTESEKQKLIELSVEHSAKGRIILAGTGLESTRETIRMTNLAARAGANAALVLTPGFYTPLMTGAAMVRHFRQVADGSQIPILIYNMPAYTHVNIPLEAVGELSQHPNIVGMKDSAGDVPRLAAILSVVPRAFNLIVGTASAWFPALTLGIRAGILALANFAGEECAEVQRRYECLEFDGAREIYTRLLPVNRAVTAGYGIAGLKYAASLRGFRGGFVRSPLLPLSASAQEEIRLTLSRAGLTA